MLVDALGDPELADRAEIALRVFGEEALDPMLEAGRAGGPNVRGATLSIMPSLAASAESSEVLDVMRQALRDTSVDVILAALRVFGGAGDASDVRDVAGFALHSDPRVADAADTALYELAARHEREARAVVAELDASRAEAVVGCIVIGALAAHGSRREGDVPFLQAALSNGDARARRAAVEALSTVAGVAGAPGTGDAHAGDAVVFALADEEPEVALAAVRALGRLRRAEPLVALLGASHEPTTWPRPSARSARPTAIGRSHAALPLVRSPDAGIRERRDSKPSARSAARHATTRSSRRSTTPTQRS